MMKIRKTVMILAILLLAAAGSAGAHCEIPCGIYGDSARVTLMREHVTTIEKSMQQVIELSADEGRNFNQLVRWVSNKEDHANQLQEIATQYFMFQRVKPATPSDTARYAAYVEQLTLLHEITVAAMKAKQTTDLTHTERLRTLITRFETAYFHK